MPKIISVLGTLALLGIVYTVFLAPEHTNKVNRNVNERSFDKLVGEMTEPDVLSILGTPDRAKGGEVFCLNSAEGDSARYSINELSRKQSKNTLNLYLGPDEETILVLFSGDTGQIVATEYRIGERPVLYRGPTIASSVKSSGVAIGTRANRKEEYADWTAAQLLRSQTLRKDRKVYGQLTSSKSTEPPPPPTSVMPEPLAAPPPEPVAPVMQEEPPPEPAPAVEPSANAANPINPGEPYVVPRIKLLPSEAVISEALVKLTEGWREGLFPPAAPVVVAQYPSRAVNAILTLKMARLNGPAVTFFEDGHLASLATYAAGELKDDYRLWDENRQRVLFAQFARGKRDGLACLFQEGRPWLIQEWQAGDVKAQYLVVFVKQKPVPVPESKLNKEQSSQFVRAQARVEEVWVEVAKTQKRLNAWLIQNMPQLRRDRAAILPPPGEEITPPKGPRIPTPREPFNVGTFEAIWRTALMQCGF